MPRIVDHNERRQQVARIARSLILSKGLDKVTVREIASLAGYSTAVVSHYFRSKEELMFLVFRDTQVAAEKRFRSAISERLPLRDCLEALLPRDKESMDSWKVWFAFWSMTLTYEDFREEQVVQARKTQTLIAQLLDDRQVPAPDEATRDVQARQLFAAVTGIATQATHDPEGWTFERQRAILDRELFGLDLPLQSRL